MNPAIPTSFECERQPARRGLLLALCCSVALHALAGGVLAPFWVRPLAEQSPPLTVALQLPPVPTREEPVFAPAPAARPREVRREPVAALPVLPVAHAPAPSPVTVERVEPAPVAAPAPGPAPPAAVAAAPAATAAGNRAAAGPPTHADVAYAVRPQPVYPPMARRLGVEGLVLLRVQVSAGGLPEHVSIAKSSGNASLDDEALRAVREARFEPARSGETAVAHVVEVPIRFRLRN